MLLLFFLSLYLEREREEAARPARDPWLLFSAIPFSNKQQEQQKRKNTSFFIPSFLPPKTTFLPSSLLIFETRYLICFEETVRREENKRGNRGGGEGKEDASFLSRSTSSTTLLNARPLPRFITIFPLHTHHTQAHTRLRAPHALPILFILENLPIHHFLKNKETKKPLRVPSPSPPNFFKNRHFPPPSSGPPNSLF